MAAHKEATRRTKTTQQQRRLQKDPEDKLFKKPGGEYACTHIYNTKYNYPTITQFITITITITIINKLQL